jgi:hypothetical protein
MTLPPPPDDDLDRLVADHLSRQAEQLDIRPLLQRIRKTVSQNSPTAVRQGRWRLAGWALPVAVAAGVAAILFFPPHAEPLRASPQALLQEAQKAHHLPLDRCYLVEFQRTDEGADEAPFANQFRTTRLWTRGDRFWIESTNPRARWAWGRDEDGTIWLAPGPRRGVRIDPDEAPRWLTHSCDISELRPEHLIGEILRDFDLVREDGPTPATQVIRASRKPGRWAPPLRSAVLELDAETKALRRVALDRAGPWRAVTTTYTLVETQTQADDRYRLDGHLVAPFEIYTADYKPHLRRQALGLVFGPRAADWFQPKEGAK